MAEPAPATSEAMECQPVDIVIARFDGDLRAALEAALQDVAFLQREIQFATLAMSYGFARGWRPKIERGDRDNVQSL